MIALTSLCAALPPTFTVFAPGEGGSKAFRIPGLLSFQSTNATVLLAYAEGRLEGCGDFDGTHTVVLKRSTDRGRTWSKIQTIMDPASILGATACPRVAHAGCEFWDPTAVYDASTSEVHLLAALSTTQSGRMSGELSLWQTTSTDLGVTWSAARNITADVARPGDAVITPGNGHATQLSSGRLLMAGYLRPAGDASEHCATIASDDHGKTWRLQPSNGNTGNGTSECEVVEVSDGAGPTVIMDERRNKEEQQRLGGCGRGVANCRWRTRSADGGATWDGPQPVPALPDPSNAGGIAGWTTRSRRALLFSNTNSQSSRVNVTLRASDDAGATWPYEALVSGPGGYSDVGLIPSADGNDEAGVLYENGTCGGIALGVVSLRSFTAAPIVATETGRVRGVATDQYRAFYGVPFAAPPIGKLRWAPPAPAASWAPATRDATAYADNCIHKKDFDATIGTSRSEDCLYLNVFTPANASASSSLPVMVWVHGGGYQGGGSHEARLNGTWDAALDADLIVVTVNYRLNIFGFLASDALRHKDPKNGTGRPWRNRHPRQISRQRSAAPW